MWFFFFELRILNDTLANFLVKDTCQFSGKRHASCILEVSFFFKGGSQKEKSQ